MPNRLINNFSGGMNTKASPLLLRENECEKIINYDLDKIGALTKRTGYDTFASQPVAGKTVLGLAQYTNTGTPAETTQVMVVNNAGNTQAVIYYNNAGTWTSSLATDTAVVAITNFNRSRFITFLDYLFRVNGQDATATSINVNGATWGATNAPTVITPSFINVFQDRVYVARNGAALASRVYFSKLPIAGAISWDTGNDFFDVNPDDGDEITGLENNGSKLLIFKNRALYRWTFGLTEADKLYGVGTESQECIKTNLDLGITFFANKFGAYAYDGGRPILISRKIQKWFDAVPAADVNDFCAEADADHYYLYLSNSMSVDETTYTNVMAVYTISLDAWTIYSFSDKIKVMSKLIQSNAEKIYFGSTDGRTYEWDSGTQDGNSNVNVSGEIITKEYLLTMPEKTMFKYIDTISQDGINTLVSYDLDRNENWRPIGLLKDYINTSPQIGKECRTVRFKFTDNGIGQSVIEGLNIEHIPQLERK